MPEAGDTGKIRKFITLKYRDKKWYRAHPTPCRMTGVTLHGAVSPDYPLPSEEGDT